MNWYLPNLRNCFTCRPAYHQSRHRNAQTPAASTALPDPLPLIPPEPCTYSCCKTSSCKKHARTCLLKSDKLSSTIIPNGTSDHTSYPLAILSFPSAESQICQALFTFSCNIRTEQASLFLNFHITQQGKKHCALLPVQSNWNYSCQNASKMDAVTFSACCSDLIANECCTICFWADVIGVSQGVTHITNSIVTALIQDIRRC